jgi:hypothetical protein
MDLTWALLCNETDAEFVTSDAPVVLYNQWCQGARRQGNTGMAASGLQVFLPLSPRFCLLLFDDDIYNVGERDGVVAVDSRRDAIGVNGLQLLAAESNLYYSGSGVPPTHSIDLLPFGWRPAVMNRVHVVRAVDAEARSQLVHLYQEPQDVGLDQSFMRVRRRQKGISFSGALGVTHLAAGS